MCPAAVGRILISHMPYIVRTDPLKAFRNLLFNVIQWTAIVGAALGLAFFLWTGRR
jgi:hypothetical protein